MKETRTYQAQIELRNADGKPMIKGHAAVFNKDSAEMFGFTERL